MEEQKKGKRPAIYEIGKDGHFGILLLYLRIQNLKLTQYH